MADDVDAEGGGSGKVLLVVGLLVGVGIGVGAGMFLGGGDEAAPVDGEEAVVEEVEEPKGAQLAVNFSKLAVPIYSKSGNKRRFIGNYFIDIRVLVYGDDNQILIKRAEPQLQHAFLSAMIKSDLLREGTNSELDLDKTAEILKKTANKIVGAGVVHEVALLNTMRLAR